MFCASLLDTKDQHAHLAARHLDASISDEPSAGCATQNLVRGPGIDITETWTGHVSQTGPEELVGIFKCSLCCVRLKLSLKNYRLMMTWHQVFTETNLPITTHSPGSWTLCFMDQSHLFTWMIWMIENKVDLGPLRLFFTLTKATSTRSSKGHFSGSIVLMHL